MTFDLDAFLSGQQQALKNAQSPNAPGRFMGQARQAPTASMQNRTPRPHFETAFSRYFDASQKRWKDIMRGNSMSRFNSNPLLEGF